MKGVTYSYDEKGRPTVAHVDLKKNRKMWEDFMDILTARDRANEPTISLEDLKAKVESRA